MNEQNASNRGSTPSDGTDARTSNRPSVQNERSEYRRQVPHITQEPIDDVETEYVMPNRYTTVDQAASSSHKHMGVATSEPEYLPRTGPQVRERQDVAGTPTQERGGRHTAKQADSLNYNRYLETPKSGRSIFISPKERRRRRNQKIAAVVAVVAVIVIVVVLIVLN